MLTKAKVLIFLMIYQSKDCLCLDTEKEDGGEATTKIATITTTESIEFDNGLKLDLSSIDGDLSDPHTRRRSIDFDYEAINRSNARVGDWETNFTLIESKVKSRSNMKFSFILFIVVVLVISFRRRNFS